VVIKFFFKDFNYPEIFVKTSNIKFNHNPPSSCGGETCCWWARRTNRIWVQFEHRVQRMYNKYTEKHVLNANTLGIIW